MNTLLARQRNEILFCVRIPSSSQPHHPPTNLKTGSSHGLCLDDLDIKTLLREDDDVGSGGGGGDGGATAGGGGKG